MKPSHSTSAINEKPLAVAIMGPTAAGKTDLAIALKDVLDAELISVDSAQVYRGMDIGSAKPTAEELARAPHALIDIRDPSEPYSAADFAKDAKIEMAHIVRKGRTPILVGGTMLYFKALLEGLSDLPQADEQVRQEIEELAKQKGWPFVHRQLAEVDAISAQKIHPNHSQRISRALEIYRITGQPMSLHQDSRSGGVLDEYRWVQLGVMPRDRRILHERIERRFRKMIELGMISEVKRLRSRPELHRDLPAIRAVGYRQVWEYLDGEYGHDEMLEKGIAATRQLAKRQITWLRSWLGLNWLHTQGVDGKNLSFGEICKNALNFIGEEAI